MLPIAKLQGAAGACALVALLTSFVALVTPAWQVVYAREIQQWVQSGLWLNCQTRPSGMYTCTYTFSESDFQFYTSAELINLRTPPFFAWQRTLLTVFLFGQLFVFVGAASLTLSFAPAMRRLSAIVNVGALSVAALLHAGGLLAFAIFSQMVEYRFYHVSVSGIYEKHRGYSFYTEMAAVGALIAALALALAHLIRERSASSKLDHNNNNNTFNNSRRYYQHHLDAQPQIFDEEPYAYQQQRNYGSSIGGSFHNSSSTVIGSQFGDIPAAPTYGVAASYAGVKSTQSLEQPPDLSLPYIPYGGDGRYTSASTPLDERAFAMRALPKLPPPYR